MGVPILLQALEQPGTSAVTAILCGVYLFLASRGIGYTEVGLSFEQAIQQLQLWRIVTAQLSHVEALHLLLNVSSLWSLGGIEAAGGPAGRGGTLYYLQTSAILLILSGAMSLVMYYSLAAATRREHFIRVTSIGYSAVIFGWMTIQAASGVAGFSIVGLTQVPMWLAPFAALALTSVIVPRASFVGHLSGILVGYMVAGGLFNWLTLFWLVSLSAWVGALLLFHMLTSGMLDVSWLRLLPGPGGEHHDIETGVAPVVRVLETDAPQP